MCGFKLQTLNPKTGSLGGSYQQDFNTSGVCTRNLFQESRVNMDMNTVSHPFSRMPIFTEYSCCTLQAERQLTGIRMKLQDSG